MVDDDVKPGVLVRVADSHQRGTVREVDRELLIARVELNTGGERWQQLGELEVVEAWRTKQRIEYIGEEA
jgi:hypothetical protein